MTTEQTKRAQHTAGPWTVAGNGGFVNQVQIEPAIGCAYGAGEEVRANARLIAAAPDLLAALVQGFAIQNGTAYGKNAKDHTVIRVLEAWMKQAEAAIRKATEHAS